MIVEIIFSIFVDLTNRFVGVWPNAGQNPLTIPFGIDNILVTGITGYKILAQAYPPFNDVLDAFIILLIFKIVLRFIKMIPIIGKSLS